MWSATQIPHILRMMLALTLGIPEHKVRVIAPDVGGGFGGKLQVTPEEVITLARRAQARQAGASTPRPASESLMAAHHGRDQIQDITLTAKRDGTVTGLDVHLLADMGAYLGLVGARRADPRRVHVQRDLQVPGLPVRLHEHLHHEDADRRLPRRGPPGGDVRHRADDGRAGRRARHGPDGAAPQELDHARGVPVHHGRGADLRHAATTRRRTDKAMELFGYDELRAEQEERRGATATRSSSASASRRSPRCAGSRRRGCWARSAYGAGGWEHASIRMLATGKVEVVTGASRTGRATRRRWSQIVADRLGVPFEDVEVLHGDTQYLAEGPGHLRLALAGGRRHGHRQGRRQGDREGASRSRRTCSRRSEDDLEFADGTFRVKRLTGSGDGDSARSRSPAFMAHDLPDGIEPILDADAVFDPENFSFPHGTHLCAVEVDTETGRRRRIRKYVCVDDVGKVVNPLIVEGQVHGGLAQGIAQALFEEAVYDDDGTLITGTFVDYTLPSAADLPSFDDRPHRDAGDVEPAGREGRRRGRHDRLHPGGRQRGRRRGAASSASTTSRCRAPRARVARDPGRRAVRQGRGRHQRRAAARVPAPRTEVLVIPAQFDYVGPPRSPTRWRRSGRRRRGRQGHRRRAEPAAGAAAAARRPDDAGRPRPDRRAAGDPRRRRRASSIGAMTHARRRAARPARQRARAAARPGHRRPSPTRRCATAARSAARSPTPTRPVTSARSRSRSDAELVIATAPAASGRSRRRTSSRTTSRPRSASDEILTEIRVPKLAPAGARTTRSSTGSRRRGRSSGWRRPCAARTARSPRPGSALTNMGSTPLRAPAVEQALAGQPTRRDEAVRAAAEHAAEGTSRTERPVRTRPTTVSIWHGYSPSARCSPRRADLAAHRQKRHADRSSST